jgi:hypothetical protein
MDFKGGILVQFLSDGRSVDGCLFKCEIRNSRVEFNQLMVVEVGLFGF